MAISYSRAMHLRTVCTTVTSGLVEGFSRDGVTRWRSIPYAEPPVGALRLRAPGQSSRGRSLAVSPFQVLCTTAAQIHFCWPRQISADERRLPDAERRRARHQIRAAVTCDGVHPWRRILPRQLRDTGI